MSGNHRTEQSALILLGDQARRDMTGGSDTVHAGHPQVHRYQVRALADREQAVLDGGRTRRLPSAQQLCRACSSSSRACARAVADSVPAISRASSRSRWSPSTSRMSLAVTGPSLDLVTT